MPRISTPWRKALRDLWLNKARTLLVVLAIAVGVFGLGLVLDSYAILTREMNENYQRTNPASATLYTGPLDSATLEAVGALPQIAEVEARRMIVGRIQTGQDEWLNIWLFVIDDFSQVRLDKFTPDSGQYPPQTGEILLERADKRLLHLNEGDTATVKIPNGAATDLPVTGIVHAPGLAPAWMEGFAYGFISRETLASLGGEPYLDELKIRVAENPLDKASIRTTAYELKTWLEQNGQTVSRIEIPEPGKHPHASQMATLLFLLETFGLVALGLSGVLTANMISALLAQQIRQIGVMKAVGGRARQVAVIYFGMVLFLGLLGLAVGIPLAVLAGRGYATFAAGMLNFQIFSDAIPLWAFALQAGVGLLIPLAAATFPIIRGSRVTVRQAINDYGIDDFGLVKADWPGNLRGLQSALSHLQSKIFPRPFLLSLRNTFRRRARLALTLGTLAVGGAGFIVAMNVLASMDSTVAARYDAARYDVQLWFSQPYPTEQLETSILAVDGVKQMESWGAAKAAIRYDDGTFGNRFNLAAPPAATQLMTELPVIEGRWLQPGDTDALVVNHALVDKEPMLKVGSRVTLRIGTTEQTWQVVGVVREIMSPPAAYANQEYFTQVTGQTGLAQSVVVVSEDRTPKAVAEVTRRLEHSLAAAGIEVTTSQQLAQVRQAIEEHLLILASLLVIMSVLVLMVGGLGLASTMSINVLERQREIGVLRAIGASTGAVLRIIVAEGMIIGGLSWLLAVALAWPISRFVSYTFGMTFFEAPLQFAVSPLGMALWLGMALLLSALASLYPALNASQMTVRQTLAYE
jgi:putative ABC transport system permease protein